MNIARLFFFATALLEVFAAPDAFAVAERERSATAPANRTSQPTDTYMTAELNQFARVVASDFDAYAALAQLQDDVEKRQAAGDPHAPFDLVLLATGFLRKEPRFLQEYLRSHNERVPDSVRARMTPALARALAEASRRNGNQAFVPVRIEISPALRDAKRVQGCELYTNGSLRGTVPGEALRVVAGVPQRIHVACLAAKQRVHFTSTFTPASSSGTEVFLLDEAHSRVFAIEDPNTPYEARVAVASEGAIDADKASNAGSGSQGKNDNRVGLTGGVLAFGKSPRRSGLHNAGMRNGLLAHGGLAFANGLFRARLEGIGARQKTSLSPSRGNWQTVQAIFASLGASAAAFGVEGEPGPRFETGASVGLWGWRCDSRPCGFLRPSPNLSVAASGMGVFPMARGFTVELGLEPGLVLGSTPLFFIDTRMQVSLDL